MASKLLSGFQRRWCEKAPGQLFCEHSSRDILELLLQECEWAGVEMRLDTSIDSVSRGDDGWTVRSGSQVWRCESLVVASGGLSIPTMGASNFGYRLAEQFGLTVLPVRAALVPFTLQPDDKAWLAPLSGASCEVAVSAGEGRFQEPMLITHRGLSGPAMLQISSYWMPGEALCVDLLPGQQDLAAVAQQDLVVHGHAPGAPRRCGNRPSVPRARVTVICARR